MSTDTTLPTQAGDRAGERADERAFDQSGDPSGDRAATDTAGLDGAQGARAAEGAAGGIRTGRTGRVRRRRGPVLALSALGVGAIAWLGWASPITLVEHVVVDAPKGISADAVRLASGISAADHVPGVDADRVRVAVMSALPAVADVDLSRSLPDTIRLRVTARTPLAAVASGKGYYLLDAEGVVYDKVASPKKLPVIRASTDVGRTTARQVLLTLPEDLRREVRRVGAKTRDDVVLSLRDGATVRWGSASDTELKVRVLAGLRVVGATRYDVSAPLLPTTFGMPEEADEGP